ncbi:hypothetical protein Rsub_01100 [Raphidocelis subcapitata]|uniref:AMP-dependent synthetase/ligase domain-containing protein n=1 Tax=Raphidocelis subcapitata TaxID=307507 RepID=A0A2V0NLR9_9CHLO|nr:hypothetical protein Rsub_01100 [Raphidocelis subcapitata]|eukprot:GBF88388.1 hypothetical protein Rsub_01100 [Raphidocelis subcapitata]
MEHFLKSPLEEVLQLSAPAAGAPGPPDAHATLAALAAAAQAHVPAYRAFAAAAGGDEGGGGAIPFTTKANYFHAYPLSQRCWGGRLAAADFVHFSSGSSGAPTSWARSADDEAEVLGDSFGCRERSSLCVVAFPLGSWVGGMFTTLCLRLLALKGYPLVVVTPGNKPPEILQVVQALGPQCDQTIILGYPPFVKGVIDEGVARGVEWGRYAIKLVLAGEVFSEEWRALVAARAGVGEPHRAIASIFGTADAGVIAQETPLSALIRRWLSSHPAAARELFGRDRLPTLAQYDPRNRLIEAHPDDGTLVISALPGPGRRAALDAAAGGGDCELRGAPLIRYCIGDAGGVLSFDDLMSFLKARGYDPIESGGDGVAPVRRQPFVFLFGRSFWAVSLFGANVYVDQVQPALEGAEDEGSGGSEGEGAAAGGGGARAAAGPAPGGGGGAVAAAAVAATAAAVASAGSSGPDGKGAPLSELLTGKFVLFVAEDDDSNPRLALRAELARGAAGDGGLAARVARAVLRRLLRVSSEYGSYVPGDVQLPLVTLHAFGDPEHFPLGVKHKYTLT